jgi:hypothetical protein
VNSNQENSRVETGSMLSPMNPTILPNLLGIVLLAKMYHIMYLKVLHDGFLSDKHQGNEDLSQNA